LRTDDRFHSAAKNMWLGSRVSLMIASSGTSDTRATFANAATKL
jgi:hypothetical protein